MVVSLGFYYKSSPDAAKSGYVMTDAKDIDAKLIRASAEPFSGKQGDEFAYYSNRHLNAVQSASIDKSIGGKRGGIIYAAYASGSLGR